MFLKLKVLGVLGLIDDDECDWKIIGINRQDPNAENYDGCFISSPLLFLLPPSFFS